MALKALLGAVKDLEDAFTDLFGDHILWQESYGRDPSGLRGGSMQKHVFAYLRDFISAVEGPPDLSFASLTPWNHSRTLRISLVLHAGVADILRHMQDHEMIPEGIDRFIGFVLFHMDEIVRFGESTSASESQSTSEGSRSIGEGSESSGV
jgi:hypothetical protein